MTSGKTGFARVQHRRESKYQRNQHAQEYESNLGVSNSQLFPTLKSKKEIALFAMLTLAAFVKAGAQTGHVKKVKHISPQFDREISPDVARGTASFQAVIPRIESKMFQLRNNMIPPNSQPNQQVQQSSQKNNIDLSQQLINHQRKQRINGLLGAKTAFLEGTHVDNAAMEGCQKLVRVIASTEVKLPQENFIAQVLSQSDFRVLCVRQSALDGATDAEALKNAESRGRFIHNNGQNFILLPIERASEVVTQKDESGMRHEFQHARHFMLHKNKNCRTTDNDAATAPIFPVSADNIEKYNNALDQGDARIREFSNLRWKKLQGIVLSKKEKKLLAKYTKASNDCLVYPRLHQITKELFNDLFYNKRIDSPDPINVDAHIEFIGNVQIVNMLKNGNIYRVRIQPTTPEQAVILMPDDVKEHLSHIIYQKNSPVGKLAERDAYTRQGLSESAFNLFYAEAAQIQEDYVRRCSL